MMKKLAFAILMLSMAACFEHTYHIGAGAPAGAITYNEWQHHWLGGLISPDKEIELRQVCPSGDATIEQEQTFLNGLVSVLTTGIYTPMTVQVRCGGTSASLDLSTNDVEQIVTAAAFLDWVDEAAPALLWEATEAQQALADF